MTSILGGGSDKDSRFLHCAVAGAPAAVGMTGCCRIAGFGKPVALPHFRAGRKGESRHEGSQEFGDAGGTHELPIVDGGRAVGKP
jgi:hypothetical protein